VALAHASATDDVVLLGVGEPFSYEGGTYEGRPYAAGVTRRICVGSLDGRDFYVMKLRTAEVERLRPVLDSIGRGVQVRIRYVSHRGQYQLLDLEAIGGK